MGTSWFVSCVCRVFGENLQVTESDSDRTHSTEKVGHSYLRIEYLSTQELPLR